MVVFGPISSVFDYLTFGLLLAGLGSSEAAFHTGWFIESLATQVLVIFVIRTGRVPFWRSRPSRWLVAAAVIAVAVAVVLPLSPLGGDAGLHRAAAALLARAAGPRGQLPGDGGGGQVVPAPARYPRR